MEKLYTRLPMFEQRGPEISRFRQFLNFLGCLIVIPVYSYITGYTRHPLTLDILLTIFAAEYNRFSNENRRRQIRSPAQATQDVEKGSHISGNHAQESECMAAIVGYREDPELFSRALDSYKGVAECRFLLVGVDGNEQPDMEMVRVFKQVFPDRCAVIHIDEPLGEMAMQTFEKLSALDGDSKAPQKYMETAIAHCCQVAREILAEHDLRLDQPDGVRKLCLYQPHLHKKGIMFTAFIFSIVISEMIGVEYLWSSDSDTIILPDSLRSTIETISGDPHVGGGSSGLIVHNENDTITTKLGSVVYWSELYMTRSTSTASGTSDCQSGPSSAFRISALPAVLYPWYTQTVLGHRMIVNEDRHLTTNLLMRGWTVTYVSDTLTATDTPTTLSRWIMQQVRWSRAGHIESFQQPKVYLLTHPLFFWAAVKREIGPLLGFGYVLYYLITGKCFAYFNWYDVGIRVAYTLLYNFFRNPDRGPTNYWLWIGPGLLFYNIPLPMIHLWSLITVFQDGWGTSMRSTGEMSKRGQAWKRWKDLGFFVVWMGIVGGVVARMAAQMAGWDEIRIIKAIALGVVIPSAISFYGLVVCE
ncbi:hyaluronan synthase [Penicillium taxi]|uniref:hyaluronan synthase n=1 Tax=Penicillium taxi TaxID=168475 RepID=UPI002544F341|nr:hyaluronan synthase [Penicillium taxi]KAJ5888203.1 hyaluronan synthase [Penicillium taxi]